MMTIKSIMRARQQARDVKYRLQWRHGFMTAVSERLFPDLPNATDKELEARMQTNQAFADGYRHGIHCALAVSLPADIGTDYQNDPQFGRATWFAAGAVALGVVLLWVLGG